MILSFFKRLNIWSKERFPLINLITAIVMVLSTKLFLTSTPLVLWGVADIAAVLFIYLHFFILRVLDEHKDFESDKIFYPDRALQKGIIQLQEIRWMGWLAYGAQVCLVVFVLAKDLQTYILYALVLTWTFLMFKEFFVGSWLRPRILLYSTLHLLVSPLMLIFVIQSLTLPLLSVKTGVVLLFSLASGFLFEISRKNKTPEQDQKGEISFSLAWGQGTTALVIFNLSCLNSLLMILICLQAGISQWATILLAIPSSLLNMFHQKRLRSFANTPSLAFLKKAQDLSGLVSIY
ncbi:MAG: hypothetical protein COT73_00490, partial [Bdellovibrio sp. CG10_big_fil_rev_8_21_14_0_10_47_8]